MDSTRALRPSADDVREGWAQLVDADARQVARLRESEEGFDYYQPVAGRFRPGQASSAEASVLLSLARADDSWLDIGAGGGRFALPLAGRVRRVVAVEPSPAMRRVLDEGARAAGATNLTVHDARWPVEGWSEQADVALAAHCLYDIREPLPFVEAMEQSAGRLCVVALARLPRGSQLGDLFEAVHEEPHAVLPALREFVALLGALGRPYEVRRVVAGAGAAPVAPEEAHALGRRMLWLRPGSEKDRRMLELMDEWWGEPGGVRLPMGFREIGIVTWEPPG